MTVNPEFLPLDGGDLWIPEITPMATTLQQAKRRAKRLLCSHLTDEQKKTLKRDLAFEVHKDKPYYRRAPLVSEDRTLIKRDLRHPRTYRISQSKCNAIRMTSDDSGRTYLICVVLDSAAAPIEDQMLALKLMIEANERGFWDLAIWGESAF